MAAIIVQAARRKSGPWCRGGDQYDRRTMAIERVGVVGSGLMGSGIAEVCARAGLDVVVREVDAGAAEAGQHRLTTSLDRGVRSGKLDRGRSATRRSPTSRFTTDLDELADRQLVVEAVVEDEALKVDVFRALDKVVTDDDAILASNTSSIPIMKLGIATPAARAGDRHPLLQPGARAAPRRAGHQPADVAGDGRPRPTRSPPTCSASR